MTAVAAVRHQVADYAAWRVIYESLEPLRLQHGCTAKLVSQAPGDPNDIFIVHEFPSVADAEAFAGSNDLKEGMQKAGVLGPPRIEIYEKA